MKKVKAVAKLKDKEATDMDWFFLEVFGKMLFGEDWEPKKPKVKRTYHK